MRKIFLYMPCPKCQQYGYHYAPEYWTHGGRCGGRLYLDEYAYVHCENCGNKAPLMQMRLTCNSGRHQYFVSSKAGYAEAISAAGMVTDRYATAWFQGVLKNL